MGWLNNISKTKNNEPHEPFVNPITTELHSHLIPGIDDGAQTLEQSIEIIAEFAKLGYRKIITTPHIMADFYKNGPYNILPGLQALRGALAEKNIAIEIEAAAEYMADDMLISKILAGEMLSFGSGYVLFEMAFDQESPHIKEIIFELQLAGYKPVLAHPERYGYYASQPHKFKELADAGVLMQININSIVGYYSPHMIKTVQWLAREKLIHFVGSDCHHMRHFAPFTTALQSELYQQICKLPLLNNTL
jgi:tyrosine-protein phosphatase YwqE